MVRGTKPTEPDERPALISISASDWNRAELEQLTVNTIKAWYIMGLINVMEAEKAFTATASSPKWPSDLSEPARAPCLQILALLHRHHYDFVAPTPRSQAAVLEQRRGGLGDGIADFLGWNIPCRPESVQDVLRPVEQAGLVDWALDGTVRARVRASQIFGNLFLHSPFPTEAQDSVFLGPDSHRFADYILRNLDGLPRPLRVLDYGAGAGVGGITAASHHGDAVVTLADINPKALAYASINAEFAGIVHQLALVDQPSDMPGEFDLIVMHPPFMIDPARRAYRDGGDLYGGRLSVDWALKGMRNLAPGGRLAMHTGVSIIGGKDLVEAALRDGMPQAEFTLKYDLLDPDIFGDELSNPSYADVDRIAAVGLCIERHRSLP